MQVRELSKGMIVQLHLALVMAIDAKLLVLDEPTLGLDILYRKQFYQRLLEDYFDEDKTILVTTHQVEEIEHILTDVMFIRDGRIVLDAPMDDVGERYVEVLVNADKRRRGPRAEADRRTRTAVRQDGDAVRRRAAAATGRARRNPHAGPGRPVRRHDEGNLRMNATVSIAERGHAPVAAPHPTHKFKLLLRREFWEHKGGFFWAPLVAGGISLLLTLMAIIVGRSHARRAHADGKHRDQRHAHVDQRPGPRHAHLEDESPRTCASSAGASTPACWSRSRWPFIVLAFVVFFYCLGALYDERKDRSVLFWKSLPVSDRETVLSKVASALRRRPGDRDRRGAG